MGTMRIISKKRLRDFWVSHADAERPLRDWHAIVERCDWRSPADIKRTFASASIVGDVVVFNIGGNKHRLTVNVRYAYHAVYVRRVMTHAAYDQGEL